MKTHKRFITIVFIMIGGSAIINILHLIGLVPSLYFKLGALLVLAFSTMFSIYKNRNNIKTNLMMDIDKIKFYKVNTQIVRALAVSVIVVWLISYILVIIEL